MSDKFKFIMPGNPEYVPGVRLAVGSIASSAGFDVEETEDITTAVGEACQLVFCHEMEGYAREYTVECETEPGKITINVINTSDELTEKTGKRCLDCPNEGELGKFVIRSLMDECEIECDDSGHRTVSMMKTGK